MDDDITDTPDGSSTPATPAGAARDEAAEALAEMRARLDEATVDIERLTTALEERTLALDEVETLADVLLGAAAAAVVVVRGDRRVRALSPAAAELLGADSSHVGRALSSVVPEEVLAVVRPHLGGEDEAGEPAEEPDGGSASEMVVAGWTVEVSPLPGGGAVVVLGEK